MIIMPVVSRPDLRWSPYHVYLGKETYLMTSLYYLPKKNLIDVKRYLSRGNVDEKRGHYSLSGVEECGVFVDNGVFTQTLKGETLPSPKDLADTFAKRVVGADIVAGGPDVPINLRGITTKEKVENAKKTASNMKEFIASYRGTARPAAVIQALDEEMALRQAKDYQDVGYQIVAVGTMGRAVTEELLKQARAVGKLGLDVHIFGATPPSVLPLLNRYQVDMCDSHSPLRWSMYGQILDPADYRIKNTKNIREEEWTCDCPVCRENLDRVLDPTTRRIADIRAVHNLLMLKRAAHDPKLKECISFAQKYYKKTPACSNCKSVRHIGDCAMKKYRRQCLVQKNKIA